MKQIYSGAVATLLLLMQCVAGYSKDPAEFSHLKISNSFFTENKGQIRDQNRNSRTDIDFSLSSRGLNVFISPGKISYQFARCTNAPDPAQDMKDYWESKFSFPGAQPAKPARQYDLYRLDMELEGADFSAAPRTEIPEIRVSNYYLPGCGTKGLSDIHTYRRVVYPDIYPGIDWVLYIKEDKLKYDFILHEGADPNRILIKYKGAANEKLAADGSLEIATPLGSVKEDAPVAWTAAGNENIKVQFKARGDQWGFALGQYHGSLVLDPGLSWSTYYGGSGMEMVKDVFTDNANIFITGVTTSLSQIATTGTYQTTYSDGDGGDAFLAKFSISGSLLWATYYGGYSNDMGWGVVTDTWGNVYMVGYTESASDIATPGSHQTVFGYGSGDGFLAKFTQSGQRVWSTYYGGSGIDYGHSIAIDGTSLYTCGTTYSNTGIATPGSYQPLYATTSNEGNAYLVKWDTAGQRQWATYYGSGTTNGSSVVVNKNHELYLAGGTNSLVDISSTGSYQAAMGGLSDAFIAKFNAAGQRLWGTYFGGTIAESTFPIALVGANNNVYLAGITYSYDHIATPGASREFFSNGVDGYLASFDSAGNRQWGTYVGPGNAPPNGIFVSDITLSHCGGVYLTGDIFPSVDLAPTADAYQPVAGGGAFDGSLLRYDDQGRAEYSTYIGSPYRDNVMALAMSKEGNLYLAGVTESDSGIATSGSYQSSFGGVLDAFLMKFQDIFIEDKEHPQAGFAADRCINDTFVVPYIVSAGFQAGNVFTAELSDSNGSFTDPLAIGSVTSSGAGIISCFIPQTVSPGTGYRLRISGSAPATAGSCPASLTLLLPPVPDVTVDGDTLTSSAVDHNQWIKNGVPVDGATGPQFVTSGDGWYRVSVTDPITGCTSFSDSIPVGNVGVEQVNNIKESMQVYPNPFDRQLNIDIASSVQDVQAFRVLVTTPMGKKVWEQSGLHHKNVLNMQHLAGGIYFIVITGPSGKAVYKVIKNE